MVRSALVLLLPISLVIACGGCGGGGSGINPVGDGATTVGDGGVTQTGPLTSSQFLTAFENALCDVLIKCNSYAPSLCQSFTSSLLGFPDLAKAIASGRVKYDGTTAQACLDQYEAVSCNAGGGLSATPASCVGVIQGTVQNGDPCYNGIDCADGTCDTTKACPGTCLAYLGTGVDCTMGGSCDSSKGESCVNGTCGAPGAVSAKCTNQGDCQAGLACTTGACAMLSGNAGPCTSTSNCQAGLYCLTSFTGTSMCTAQLAKGVKCGEDEAHYFAATYGGECATGLLCVGVSMDSTTNAVTSGICQTPSDVGGSCVLTTGSTGITGCLTGLACVMSKCAIPPSTGPCSGDPTYMCSSTSTCNANKMCIPPAITGAACSLSSECQSQSCDTATMTCAASTECAEP